MKPDDRLEDVQQRARIAEWERDKLVETLDWMGHRLYGIALSGERLEIKWADDDGGMHTEGIYITHLRADDKSLGQALHEMVRHLIFLELGGIAGAEARRKAAAEAGIPPWDMPVERWKP